LISGESGGGKTYIAHLWVAKSKAVFLTLDNLATQIKNNVVMEYDAFVIEDLERYLMLPQPNEALQETLFNFFNMCKEAGNKHILFSSSVPIANLNITLEDLRSRLSSIPVLSLEEPDEEALRIMLFKQFADYQLRANKEVIDYILKRIDRSFSAIKNITAEIDSRSLQEKRNITVPFIKKIIH
jgi:chromosomal replication initiation ATPase DnaA